MSTVRKKWFPISIPDHEPTPSSQASRVERESEVAQSCPTPSDPMDCSLPGSSIRGIFQARVLEGLPFPAPGASRKNTTFASSTESNTTEAT